jgi:hypothetical protein
MEIGYISADEVNCGAFIVTKGRQWQPKIRSQKKALEYTGGYEEERGNWGTGKAQRFTSSTGILQISPYPLYVQSIGAHEIVIHCKYGDAIGVFSEETRIGIDIDYLDRCGPIAK